MDIKNSQSSSDNTSKKRIFNDRERTHIFKNLEQKSILFLVEKIPLSISPNKLTFIGFMGSLLVLVAFILATYIHLNYLLLGILGLAINWFGDSLDGRIAYFRKIPRKWYGFSLDIIMDWIGTIMIGLGYMIYETENYKIIAFLFVVFYGWAMIITLLRYKITNQYQIDSGLFGPTEVRILIALILLIEIWFPESIRYFALLLTIILFFVNVLGTKEVLKFGDLKDIEDRNVKNE
jgi:phosphatidylglycerophosphate synthase